MAIRTTYTIESDMMDAVSIRIDEALYYLEAAFESPTVDVTDAQLKEAVTLIVERNELLEQALTDAYTAFDKAQGILGKVL